MDFDNTRGPFKVLVFSKTSGFRHKSIPAGISGLRRLAESSRRAESACPPFAVEASEDARLFTEESLSEYRVVVLLNSSGEFLDNEQLEALKRFVRSGGGVVGIHCASTGMPSGTAESVVDGDGWYGRMIGAAFTEHPVPQHGVIRAQAAAHPIVSRGLDGDGQGLRLMTASAGPGCYERRWFDEWYNFSANPRAANGVDVLLVVDEASYEGGTLGSDHPVMWCHEFEGGRSFYTALGHFDAAYEDDMFMGHVLNGILWTAGLV